MFRRRLDFENVSGSSNSNEGLPGDHDKLLVRKTSGKPKQGHLQEGCQAAIFHRKSSEEPKQVHIQGGCQALNSVRKTSGEPKHDPKVCPGDPEQIQKTNRGETSVKPKFNMVGEVDHHKIGLLVRPVMNNVTKNDESSFVTSQSDNHDVCQVDAGNNTVCDLRSTDDERPDDCYVDLGADECNELGCQGSDYNQKSNDRSSYDQGLTSECSDSDMSNIPELTSGTESSRSENLRNTDSDSGTSEIKWVIL